jgi:Fe-S cluster biogenesis protein NfuA
LPEQNLYVQVLGACPWSTVKIGAFPLLTDAPTEKEGNMREKVEQVLEKIRPTLQADGGDVELVEVTENGIVKVRLQGACKGCPMSQITLKNGIERLLLKEIPELKAVEAV